MSHSAGVSLNIHIFIININVYWIRNFKHQSSCLGAVEAAIIVLSHHLSLEEFWSKDFWLWARWTAFWGPFFLSCWRSSFPRSLSWPIHRSSGGWCSRSDWRRFDCRRAPHLNCLLQDWCWGFSRCWCYLWLLHLFSCLETEFWPVSFRLRHQIQCSEGLLGALL